MKFNFPGIAGSKSLTIGKICIDPLNHFNIVHFIDASVDVCTKSNIGIIEKSYDIPVLLTKTIYLCCPTGTIKLHIDFENDKMMEDICVSRVRSATIIFKRLVNRVNRYFKVFIT